MSDLSAGLRWVFLGAVGFFAVLTWLTWGPLHQDGFGTFDAPVDYGYDIAAAREYLAFLWEEPQRAQTYLRLHQKLDTAFPILLAWWLAGVIWMHARRKLLLGLPLLYLCADMAENFGVADLIRAGGNAADADIVAVRFLTAAKMVVLGLSGLCAVVFWVKRRRDLGGT